MTQQNLRPQIALAAAALVLGVALAPVSAFAQARGVNDGGQVTVPPGATLDGGSKSAATPTTTYYGRGADDGGTGPQPPAAQVSATQAKAAAPKKSKTASAPAPVVIGRSVNDGGPVNQ